MPGPLFLVLEGIDATGKTTLARRLAGELGGEYIKGGGWFESSDLAERSTRERRRDFYFSLMQMRSVRQVKEKLEKAREKEGIIGVLDRFVLVDVGHRLAFAYNEATGDFSEKAKEQARQALKKFMPEEVFGVVLDVGNIEVVEGRILKSLKSEGKSPPKRDLLSWLEKESYLPEADTLRRFEVKRKAWLWCAQELGWPVVDASGSEEEVYCKTRTLLQERRFWPEGQARLPEGLRREVE